MDVAADVNNCDSLSQIHRAVFVARRNAQKKVAMAQIVIGKTGLFRAEEDCDAARRQSLVNLLRRFCKRVKFMLQFAMANGSGADHQAAIARGVCDRVVFFGSGKERRCADGGYRFPEGFFVRHNHAKMQRAEIAHGASRCADIQRIARTHQHDSQVWEVGPIFQLFHRQLSKGRTQAHLGHPHST